MRMVKWAAGEQVTIELWDGSVFPGLFLLCDDDGIFVERTGVNAKTTFAPWHSIKVVNA
jgi:hypothetical protein